MSDFLISDLSDAVSVETRGLSSSFFDFKTRWWWVFGLVLVAGVLVCGMVGQRSYRKQRSALKSMRDAVEASMAPGEAVVVDDRLLGWALRRGRDGVLRDSVWTVSEDVPAASLLYRMLKTGRREMVVVATPDDGLIRNLDAAGFTVAQEVGWVPWDVSRRGLSLLGRGRKRIYFAVIPKPRCGPSTTEPRGEGAPGSRLR